MAHEEHADVRNMLDLKTSCLLVLWLKQNSLLTGLQAETTQAPAPPLSCWSSRSSGDQQCISAATIQPHHTSSPDPHFIWVAATSLSQQVNKTRPAAWDATENHGCDLQLPTSRPQSPYGRRHLPPRLPPQHPGLCTPMRPKHSSSPSTLSNKPKSRGASRMMSYWRSGTHSCWGPPSRRSRKNTWSKLTIHLQRSHEIPGPVKSKIFICSYSNNTKENHINICLHDQNRRPLALARFPSIQLNKAPAELIGDSRLARLLAGPLLA